MPGSVIVASARTPIGKLSGSLSSLTAPDLGGHAIAAALARAGVAGDQVDHVILGQVLQAGAGQVPARQAGAKGGVPLTVPSKALNSACLSGMDAIYAADQMIQSGDADIVVAGGMESMTRAPYLLQDARGTGTASGTATCSTRCSTTGSCVPSTSSTWARARSAGRPSSAPSRRAMQDEIAAKSHERAANAAKEGRVGEIAPIEIPQRRGDPILIDTDEGIRPGTTTDSLADLRAAFAADGTITAGNASQISDGAAAVVVMSRAKADALGIEPLAELVSFATVAGPDTSLMHQPSNATHRALDKAGLAIGDVDLFEINEAFAAVGLASMADIGISDDVVNVNGGAIALGHPIGMSGARDRAHARRRVASPRWRRRRGVAVRRWRSGRGDHRPHAVAQPGARNEPPPTAATERQLPPCARSCTAVQSAHRVRLGWESAVGRREVAAHRRSLGTRARRRAASAPRTRCDRVPAPRGDRHPVPVLRHDTRRRAGCSTATSVVRSR